jgi:hypothetical protein
VLQVLLGMLVEGGLWKIMEAVYCIAQRVEWYSAQPFCFCVLARIANQGWREKLVKNLPQHKFLYQGNISDSIFKSMWCEDAPSKKI